MGETPKTASTSWLQLYDQANPSQHGAIIRSFKLRTAAAGLSRSNTEVGIEFLKSNGDIEATASASRIKPHGVRFHLRTLAHAGMELRPERPRTKSKILQEDSIRILSSSSKNLCLSTMSIARYSDCGRLLKTLSWQEVDELYFAHVLSYVSRTEWRKPMTMGACRYLYRCAAAIRPVNAETLFCFVRDRAAPRLKHIHHLFRYLETIITRNWRKPREKHYRELLPAFLPRPDFTVVPPLTIRVDHRPIPTNSQLRLMLENAERLRDLNRRRPLRRVDRPPPRLLSIAEARAECLRQLAELKKKQQRE
jgi:hypothetical protein